LSSEIDRVPVRGIWWRQVAAGLDPLVLREPPGDGRWQRGEVVGATYLADSEDTVWAEWYRALAELALPPRVWLPCELWRAEVALEEIADLSDEERLEAVGLGLPRPERKSWPSYQAVGERLHGEGLAGLIAPSAARAEGRVLCLYRDAGELPGVRPLGRPRRVAEPPTPPRGLRT
jgi:RES domain-containing protein